MWVSQTTDMVEWSRMAFQFFLGTWLSFPIWVYNVHLQTLRLTLFHFFFLLSFLYLSLLLKVFSMFCFLASSFVVSSSWAEEYFPINAVFLSILKQRTSIYGVGFQCFPVVRFYSWLLNFTSFLSEHCILWNHGMPGLL